MKSIIMVKHDYLTNNPYLEFILEGSESDMADVALVEFLQRAQNDLQIVWTGGKDSEQQRPQLRVEPVLESVTINKMYELIELKAPHMKEKFDEIHGAIWSSPRNAEKAASQAYEAAVKAASNIQVL